MPRNSGPIASFEQIVDVDQPDNNNNENVNDDANNNADVVVDETINAFVDVDKNATEDEDVDAVETINEDVAPAINIDDYITVADPKYMIGIYFEKPVAKVLRKLTKGKKGAQSRLVNDALKKLFQDYGYL